MSFRRMIYVRKTLIVFVFLFLLFVTVLLVRYNNNALDNFDRKIKLEKIDEFVKTQSSSISCKQPNLPVNSPEMMKFVFDVPPINCKDAGPDWVVCEGSVCRIQEQVKVAHDKVTCSFTDILRQDEFNYIEGDTTESDTQYTLEKSDVVKVACKTASTLWPETWSSVLVGVRKDRNIWDNTGWNYLPNSALKLNVLMFGFDSISRNTFIRKLPKSYNYMMTVLKSNVLLSYNIVGDGTPQALIPILTGQTELELPDTRRRFPKTKSVNVYPFIWNDFKKAGYVTAFLEDLPEQGTFTYRLNGFDEPPTDHYMRTYYVASSTHRNRKWPKLCAGSIPRHKVMFNFIRDFFRVYKSKPKFLFGFHGELSHDQYNLIGAADDDVLEFLTSLKEDGVLNDTILIFMADHGHRFAEIRSTIQGKLEERLPFFSFTFPPWFQSKYKEAHDNFMHNINILTAPWDIHSTLKSVLRLDSTGVADLSRRNVSLFTKIPEKRSCADAYIEPHWCACLEWTNIPLSSPVVQRLADALISSINSYTSTHRELCEILKLNVVNWVTKMEPNKNLIKFNKNADLDGFVADLSAKMNIPTDMYQIQVVLVPGNSSFEASIAHHKDTDKFVVKFSDISRINMYGKQARCIENEFPHLRKYCYCKD